MIYKIIFWNHFRTIFVKPENAINIPEKYKKKIEAIQQIDKKPKRKKNPIRIKQPSNFYKSNPFITQSKKEESATKIKVTVSKIQYSKTNCFTFLSAEEAKKGREREEEKGCKAVTTRLERLWYSRTS